MARTLTARTIETIKPGKARREIPDAHMPGLYLVIQPSGARSWAVRYRHHGRPRKHTLGSFPAVDLKTARTFAGKALRAAAEGRDPGREKIQGRAAKADSVDTVVAQFLERHSNRHNRARTARLTQRLFELYVLPRWRTRMVHEITRRDVLDVLDRVVDAGKPVQANRVFSALRKMFNWAIARDIVAHSPCTGIRRPSPERSRDRVLSDAELRAVWLAADRIGWPLVKLLTLTGQRRDEVAKIEWSEIDLKARTWTLPAPRVKNNKPHEVPLSDAAVNVLNALPRIGDRFAFTARGDAPSNGYSENKRKLDALLPPDMPPWVLHDLRRTVASGMARLGVALPVIEKILNHSSGSFAGIVGVYQKHEFSIEKRHALETWGAFVVGLVADKPRKNVVALRKARNDA
jgi:integrase